MSVESEAGFRHKLRHLLPYYRENLFPFAVGFILLALTSLAAAAIPYLMKLATDAVTGVSQAHSVEDLALIMAAIAVVHAFLRIKSRTYIFRIGREIEYRLRRRYHAKLQALDAPFFHQEKTGDLVSRGTGDILSVRMFVGPGFLQLCNTAMIYAAALPMMIWLDPGMALMALAPFPIVLLAARFLTAMLYKRSQEVAERFGDLSGFVQETVAGISVIRAHAMEGTWSGRLREENAALYKAALEHARLQAMFPPLMMFSGGLGAMLILYYGGLQVAGGAITIGDFVAFLGYLALLVWPTVGFGWILTVLQRGLAALARLGRILDAEPALTPPPETSATQPAWRGAIDVKNLTFAYGKGEPVLKNISLSIPPGAFIGLVGRVGSGKSTLLNCLARLQPVEPGRIFHDGRDLLEIPESALRTNLAMAPQESFLFSAKIRENLLFGTGEGAIEQAREAARLAAFDGEVEGFPDQFDTIVGERGITLSGGQRQRAALGRALAVGPKTLLLDDIFASVDARTEAEILENVRGYAEGRTTIMVCHRIHALEESDQIFVLDDGTIAAQGTHEELLRESPIYRDLHAQMARREALEALS